MQKKKTSVQLVRIYVHINTCDLTKKILKFLHAQFIAVYPVYIYISAYSYTIYEQQTTQ